MSRVAIALALRCPSCGADLTGGPEDALLACLDCRVAWPTEPARHARSADGATLPVPIPIPLEIVALPPQQRASAGPLLPFWRFEGVTLEAAAGEGDARVALAPGGDAAAGRTAFVLAARVRKFQVHGDPGLEYTRRPPRLELAPPGAEPRPLLPIARTLEDAERVLRVLVLRLASEAVEGAPQVPEGSPQAPEGLPQATPAPAVFRRAILWCVPLVVDGAHVRLPHCAVRFPEELVEGYATRSRSRAR